MLLLPAIETLVKLRGERIVVTTMGAAREWPKLSDHPLDLHYIPSAMGQAPALGLGLALAKPKREVLVVTGDGAMLMNLGALVTIVASRATNLTLIVLDNGLYEVTGGQRTAAAAAARVDLAAIAQAAGFTSVARTGGRGLSTHRARPDCRAPGAVSSGAGQRGIEAILGAMLGLRAEHVWQSRVPCSRFASMLSST